MERIPSGERETPADGGHPVRTGSGWDLADAAFIEEFDERADRYRVKYDSVRATPSFAVVAVVSNITGIDPLELDPLYESIEPDALNALFTADISSAIRLTFQYSGYEITVGNDDVVELAAA